MITAHILQNDKEKKNWKNGQILKNVEKKNIEKNGKICKKKNMKKLAYSLIKRGCIKIVFKYLLVTVYRSIT